MAIKPISQLPDPIQPLSNDDYLMLSVFNPDSGGQLSVKCTLGQLKDYVMGNPSTETFYLILALNNAGDALLMQKNPDTAINLYPLDNLDQPQYEQGLITAPSIASIPQIYNIRFSTDDSLLGLQHIANGKRAVSFFVKNTATGQYDVEATFSPPVAGWDSFLNDAQFSINHDGSWVVVINQQNHILIYKRTSRSSYVLHETSSITSTFSLSFSPDGQMLAVHNGDITFYDFSNGSLSNPRLFLLERQPVPSNYTYIGSVVWVANTIIAIAYSWLNPDSSEHEVIKAYVDTVRVGATGTVLENRDNGLSLNMHGIDRSMPGFIVNSTDKYIYKLNADGLVIKVGTLDPSIDSYGFAVKPNGSALIMNSNHLTELTVVPILLSNPPV